MTADLGIQRLLKQSMGLDVASIGPASILRAARRRMVHCQMTLPEEYLNLLRDSKEELQELIETTVIPETWFFRDREPFRVLGSLAITEWLPAHPEGKLRLFSIPCATGEEPFSMVMALMDAGFPARRFEIDAVDISNRVLAIARDGTYGANSFRGANLGFRDRYFRKTATGYTLAESVREPVTFQNGNLLDPKFHPGSGIYDFIFCRNLLIYFDRAVQKQVIQVLKRLLNDKGVLFIGHAEAGAMLNQGFLSTQDAMTFSYRKGESNPRNGVAEKARKGPRARTTRTRNPQPPPTTIVRPLSRESFVSPAQPKQDFLTAAHKMADEGRLVEAAQICETNLRDQGPSAEAFYLLGMVRDATGNRTEAAEFYRKAIYLKPDHYEAIVHLALLMEKEGNKDRAASLHDRARRLKEQP